MLGRTITVRVLVLQAVWVSRCTGEGHEENTEKIWQQGQGMQHE